MDRNVVLKNLISQYQTIFNELQEKIADYLRKHRITLPPIANELYQEFQKKLATFNQLLEKEQFYLSNALDLFHQVMLAAEAMSGRLLSRQKPLKELMSENLPKLSAVKESLHHLGKDDVAVPAIALEIIVKMSSALEQFLQTRIENIEDEIQEHEDQLEIGKSLATTFISERFELLDSSGGYLINLAKDSDNIEKGEEVKKYYEDYSSTGSFSSLKSLLDTLNALKLNNRSEEKILEAKKDVVIEQIEQLNNVTKNLSQAKKSLENAQSRLENVIDLKRTLGLENTATVPKKEAQAQLETEKTDLNKRSAEFKRGPRFFPPAGPQPKAAAEDSKNVSSPILPHSRH